MYYYNTVALLLAVPCHMGVFAIQIHRGGTTGRSQPTMFIAF